MTYRYAKAPTTRQGRVAEAIREAVAQLLVEQDLGLEGNHHRVTVSHVKVSPDFSIATIFVIAAPGEEERLLHTLNQAVPQIRKYITPRLNLRYSPNIRFAIDKGWEYERDIEALLDKHKGENHS